VSSLYTLQHFMGSSQRRSVIHAIRGEEREWFVAKMAELARVVETMPETGETDGEGDAVVAHLHYFCGGVGNWYITEKDKGDSRDEVPGRQIQAFGMADLYGDGGEVGYIDIGEILDNGGELDFHWKPKTLAEIRDRQEVKA